MFGAPPLSTFAGGGLPRHLRLTHLQIFHHLFHIRPSSPPQQNISSHSQLATGLTKLIFMGIRRCSPRAGKQSAGVKDLFTSSSFLTQTSVGTQVDTLDHKSILHGKLLEATTSLSPEGNTDLNSAFRPSPLMAMMMPGVSHPRLMREVCGVSLSSGPPAREVNRARLRSQLSPSTASSGSNGDSDFVGDG
jgi:hypothetical protein